MNERATDIAHDTPEVLSLWARLTEAWWDMRASMRRLLSEAPSEGRLLFYVLLSDMLTFLSWTMKGVITPSGAASNVLPLEISLYLVGMLLLRTAALYLAAGVIGAACKAFGGAGSWRDTRAAVFWGALVAAPVGLVFAMVSVALALGEGHIAALGAPILNALPYVAGTLAFFWFVAIALAEAHQFKAGGVVFTVFLLASIAAGLAGLYLLRIGGLL